jgi:hypothetical protein
MNANESDETADESVVESETEDESYISESSLSGDDLPEVMGGGGEYGSEVENASEAHHNPEDFEGGFSCDRGEA